MSAGILRTYFALFQTLWIYLYSPAFFHSFLINQPVLIQLVLQQRLDDFSKSSRIATGLYSLLGESVFLTTGSIWQRQRQRRIVNPAFEGGEGGSSRLFWPFKPPLMRS